MHFLRVKATFYIAVNMIHDVITTANPFPYNAKFMFVGVRNNNLTKSDIERSIIYVHSVALYQKYLTRSGEMIIFSPKLENYLFSKSR